MNCESPLRCRSNQIGINNSPRELEEVKAAAAVVSTVADQYIQHALQAEDCFSANTPQHILPPPCSSPTACSVATCTALVDELHENQYHRSLEIISLGDSRMIRHPSNFSAASKIVQQLLQPLYIHELSYRDDGNVDSLNEEDIQAIKDFHKSCSSNLFFFLGALFYFLMAWLDICDVLLFPHKGFSISAAYVLAFGNRTVVILVEEKSDYNYTDYSNSTYYQGRSEYYNDYYAGRTSNTSAIPSYIETLVQGPLVTASIYQCFYIMATLCFLVNAIIDFRWAKRLANELKSKTVTETMENSAEFPSISIQESQLQCISTNKINDTTLCPNTKSSYTQQQNTKSLKIVDNHRCTDSREGRNMAKKTTDATATLQVCIIKDRRALYPRRETSVKEKLAILFGSAAVIDFIGALCYDGAPKMSNTAYVFAVHLYAAAALLSFSGRDVAGSTRTTITTKTPIFSLPSVEDIGDALFLAGSIIDVTMSYFYALPRIEKSPTFVACAGFASALWLLDSIVYIIATSRTRRRAYEDVFEEEERLMHEFGAAPLVRTHPYTNDDYSQSTPIT